MSLNKVTFISTNTQGLSDELKRRDTFNFLKSMPYIFYKIRTLQIMQKIIFASNGATSVILVISQVSPEWLQCC